MTREQWLSVLRGAGVAFAGAVLTVLPTLFAGYDFGPYIGPFVAAGLAVISNVLRKYVTENDVKTPQS